MWWSNFAKLTAPAIFWNRSTSLARSPWRRRLFRRPPKSLVPKVFCVLLPRFPAMILDPVLMGQEVFYKHDREQKISPGTIVPLDITLWPMGMVFAPNEGIMLRVSGHFISAPVSTQWRQRESDIENVGYHHIHTGGRYDSSLTLPIVAGSRA